MPGRLAFIVIDGWRQRWQSLVELCAFLVWLQLADVEDRMDVPRGWELQLVSDVGDDLDDLEGSMPSLQKFSGAVAYIANVVGVQKNLLTKM